jgi:hypothetical protein
MSDAMPTPRKATTAIENPGVRSKRRSARVVSQRSVSNM